MSSASILASHVIGSTLEELVTVRDEMRAMLKENGPPPGGKFEELKFLEPVRDYRARHASTLLAFEASVEAMEKALQDCCRSMRIGKILVDSNFNDQTRKQEAKTIFAKLPHDITKRNVLLLYPIMSSGNKVCRAMQVLKEHKVIYLSSY